MNHDSFYMYLCLLDLCILICRVNKEFLNVKLTFFSSFILG